MLSVNHLGSSVFGVHLENRVLGGRNVHSIPDTKGPFEGAEGVGLSK